MSLLELRLPNVIVHGEVDDAAQFIASHSVMIVPLFSGSGMRVKIVEGMMMGKIIMTTSIGKEGIEGKHKQDFLVAENENEFIEAIQFCVDQPQLALNISKHAQENAVQQFDGGEAAKKIFEIYRMLMTYKGQHSDSSLSTLTN